MSKNDILQNSTFCSKETKTTINPFLVDNGGNINKGVNSRIPIFSGDARRFYFFTANLEQQRRGVLNGRVKAVLGDDQTLLLCTMPLDLAMCNSWSDAQGSRRELWQTSARPAASPAAAGRIICHKPPRSPAKREVELLRHPRKVPARGGGVAPRTRRSC